MESVLLMVVTEDVLITLRTSPIQEGMAIQGTWGMPLGPSDLITGSPFGPWEPFRVLFDPTRGGYCRGMVIAQWHEASSKRWKQAPELGKSWMIIS